MKTLFLFVSTHDVIRAERLCAAGGMTVRVVAVPRQLSAECGMALEVLRREKIPVRTIAPAAAGH